MIALEWNVDAVNHVDDFLKRIKVFYSGSAIFMKEWFSEEEIKHPRDADLILFPDRVNPIHPHLYKESVHHSRRLSVDEDSKAKNFEETLLFYNSLDIPKFGICHGGDLLCFLNGGRIIQKVNGHYTNHNIETVRGDKYWVQSSHDTMMDIRKVKNAELIAWADHNRSTSYQNSKGELNIDKSFKEPEVVFFPKTKSLSIAFRPDYCTIKDETLAYAKGLVYDLINDYL